VHLVQPQGRAEGDLRVRCRDAQVHRMPGMIRSAAGSTTRRHGP
jgi:hypothetical protein